MENDDYDRALAAARRLAGDYLDGLRERPVGREVDPAALAARLDEPLPERGCEPAEALAEWWRRAETGVVASPGPRFFGFVNGGATPAALAGDWLASALDQNAIEFVDDPEGDTGAAQQQIRQILNLDPNVNTYKIVFFANSGK